MVSTRRSLFAAAAASASKRASCGHDGDSSMASPPTDSSSVEPKPAVKRAKKKATSSSSNDSDAVSEIKETTNGKLVLFSLQDDSREQLVAATLVCRPSKHNKSPYVADIEIVQDDDDDERIESRRRLAICHVPSLDMGGKCVAGSQLLVRAARDKKGQKVSADAVSQKYGTPKCEFISQLLYVDESSYETTSNNNDVLQHPIYYPPTWIGAHPSLGERIAETWFRRNLVEGIPPAIQIETQVRNPCGADMRCDFVLTLENGEKWVVEVKTVVDTDYSAQAPPPPSLKCRFISHHDHATAAPYTRTAIFPWGKSNQKGPNGEKVVSARAIKHVMDLTKIAKKELPVVADTSTTYKAVVLFVVIRGDAEAFRPNHEACPSFCRYLKEAHDAGVQVLAKRVSWDEHGVCYNDKMLPIDWVGQSEEDS